MPITGKGWELHVERFAVHKKGSTKRTFGRYQAFIKGVAQAGLNGFICEAQGPGDNSKTGKNKRRVEAGRYQLFTQFGKYRSMGYANEDQPAGTEPMPGFRLENRGVRTDILVHPGHPPTLYLSSIGCFNPTEQIAPDEAMNFWDSRRRVIALLESLEAFAPSAFEDEVITEIPGAFIVIDGEPMEDALAVPMAAARSASAEAAMASALAMPTSLPISEAAARKCAKWLWQNFRAELTAAVQGKPYGVRHLAAIVCQETAYKWVPWIGEQSVKTIVERAVYDASGDDPSSPRDAFPRNTAAFRERFGKAFTDMLIEEANKTRALQGWGPKKWVYKGYGLFQYDLQHVSPDRAFFEEKQWYDFRTCARKCTMELDSKLIATHGDLWKAIRAYNGSGPKAQKYMENVRYYAPICAEVVGEADLESLVTSAVAAAATKTLSGPEWVLRFPDGGKVEDLEPTFRTGCEGFIAALRKAGATVVVHSTRRPRERAYLMNAAWRIAREGIDPEDVEPFPGVDIEWVHRKGDGTLDQTGSRKAAAAMVKAYNIAFRPALKGNHISGKAIDMTIKWNGSLSVANAKNKTVAITGAPRSGMNPALWPVGGSYGVKKLASDPPHWSVNGH
jgi:hypothetical protein